MYKSFFIAAAVFLSASSANASVLFKFEQVGNDVTMTSSGTLDTSKLIGGDRGTWGGTGIEDNDDGQTDIMGGTSFGQVDLAFAFSNGTDQSAWLNPGGPFDMDYFAWNVDSGSHSFTTYHIPGGVRNAGIGIVRADMVGDMWTPDQNWTASGVTLAGIGLVEGTFAVSDASTGETITIMVGDGMSAVPLPATLTLLLAGIGGFAALRRRV